MARPQDGFRGGADDPDRVAPEDRHRDDRGDAELTPALRPLTLGLLLALGGAAFGRAADQRPFVPTTPVRVPLDFKHYYPYEEIVSTLHLLAREFPGLARVYTIGQSREGRDLWVLEVTNHAHGEAATKPALFVQGNIHGNEIQGAEVSLYTAWYLLNRYAQGDPYVRRLVDNRTWYFLPVVNPDSRVRFFEQPNTPNSPRHNSRPYDNDNDGLVDEDPPIDLNGDGQLTVMRKRDPFGSQTTGTDPRETAGRGVFERGEWTVLGLEGMDHDGDGRTGEDGLGGGLDLNRNYPRRWRPPHVQFGAGPYPASEPEILAVVEFTAAHPNIQLFQDFHNAGNLILVPPDSYPFQNIPARDRAFYTALGQRGTKFLPDYEPMSTADSLYVIYGGSADFSVEMHGIWSLSNELWATPEGFTDLQFNDWVLHGSWFTEWQPFRHPQFGDIEIGGWNQFSSRTPPADYLEEMCQRNALYLLFKAAELAALAVVEATAEPLGGGVYRVKARVASTGSFPTRPAIVEGTGVMDPVVARLDAPPPVTILAAGEAQRFTWALRATEQPQRPRPLHTITLGTVDGHSDRWLVWLLRKDTAGPVTVTISASSPKTGRATATVELR